MHILGDGLLVGLAGALVRRRQPHPRLRQLGVELHGLLPVGDGAHHVFAGEVNLPRGQILPRGGGRATGALEDLGHFLARHRVARDDLGDAVVGQQGFGVAPQLKEGQRQPGEGLRVVGGRFKRLLVGRECDIPLAIPRGAGRTLHRLLVSCAFCHSRLTSLPLQACACAPAQTAGRSQYTLSTNGVTTAMG